MTKFKKALSVILSVCLALSVLPIFASATAKSKNDPIIFVRGDSCELEDKDGNIIDKEFDTSRIGDMVKDIIFPYFVNAVTRGTDADWQAYYDKFAEEIGTIYEDWRLDDNGEASNGSGPSKEERDLQEYIFSSDHERDGMYKFTDNQYSGDEHHFRYDPRIDPFDNARILNERIKKVKSMTGHDKVQLTCVCYGAEVVLAYLEEYGTDDISTLFFDTSVAGGVVPFGGLATGNIKLDGDAIQRTIKNLQDKNNRDDDSTPFSKTLYTFLSTTVEMLNQYKLVDILGVGLTPFIDRIAHGLLPQVYMASYGTSPGYWATISNDEFDEAVENTFSVKDYRVRYAGLIEKITNYHDKVGSRYMEILEGAKSDGIKIGVISKYGWSNTPVFDNFDELGDRTTLCKYSSFGATCSKASGTLSKDYIAKQTEKGLGKYISPDKQVDASTCLVPDTTWFTKGVEHDLYPGTKMIFEAFVESNGNFTVWDDPKWPQYLVVDRTDKWGERVVPMTTENMNDGTNWQSGKKDDHISPKSFVKAITDWIVSLIAFVKQLFNKIFKK